MLSNLPASFSYEVVPDILKPDAFDEALKKHPDAVGFFHTASPVSFSKEDYENDVILPAISGTTNVITAIKRCAPQIKRFVYTSSFAAVGFYGATKKDTVTEDSWNPIARDGAFDGQAAYRVSKTWAEKAVWEFVDKEKPNFTFNTVNPVFVLGPQAFDLDAKGDLNMSAEIVGQLLKLKSGDSIPKALGGFIDVRDVARAHIFAYETNLTSTRLLLFEEDYTSQKVMNYIINNFPQMSHLPAGNPEQADSGLENYPVVSNSRTRELIGPFITLEKSVVDMVLQILA